MMADFGHGLLNQSMAVPSRNEVIGRTQLVGPATRSTADYQHIDGQSAAEPGQPTCVLIAAGCHERMSMADHQRGRK